MRGFIARAGGSVDQLVDYKHCSVEDINIPDGGFGKVMQPGKNFRDSNIFSFIKRYVKQEVKFMVHGARISRDRKTVVLDMHHAWKQKMLRGKYDGSISSNLIEHSPNPIMLLLNFHLITKKRSFQFHAIPHYKYTYDRYRVPTSLEHFIEDFESKADASDHSHVEDYRQSAIEKDGWQKNFHEVYPLEYPFIHYHVFDEHNTKALFEYVFQDVTNDVYKTDRFSDNVVIARNELNPDFVERYRDVLQEITG
ncbi:MAG: hypothetical protein OEL66_08990 [Desulfobulbaceae bacterium]|nr:hypothetical protein [Desulfobulbaceae bacterium]